MRRVTSADGTRIALYEYGEPGAPVLLCVHGYPDNATLWDPVATRLADQFHVSTYDVRGAGESDHPRGRAAYKLERLEEDFTAVLDAVAPDQPVQLLAHDWGSIQSWHFATSDRLRGRIASFVSISGPCLDHAGYFLIRGTSSTSSCPGCRSGAGAGAGRIVSSSGSNAVPAAAPRNAVSALSRTS